MSAIYQNGVWYCPTGVHSGFTPVGTVISVMGVTAPMNYLACDGQVVNISEYPELALYFETQFGDKNHFGGDGIATFGIPDLRGEFLRGTGTNSHTNQGNGTDVGEHQDGTVHANLYFNNNGNLNTYFRGESGKNNLGNPDFAGPNSTSRTVYNKSSTATSYMNMAYGTSRPTNTSVLYCIATKNIFMDAGSNYSLEEQVVGTWVDGKPIYQKTIPNIEAKSPKSGTLTETVYDISDLSIDTLVEMKNKFQQTVNGSTAMQFDYSAASPIINNNQLRCSIVVYYALNSATNPGKLIICNSMGYTRYVTVTLQYTKTTD